MERLAIELANHLKSTVKNVIFIDTSGTEDASYDLGSGIELVTLTWDPELSKMDQALEELSTKKIDTYIYFCTNHKLLFHVAVAVRLDCRIIITESASPQRITYTNWRSRNPAGVIANATERYAALSLVDAIRVEVPESVNSFPSWMRDRVCCFMNGTSFSGRREKEPRTLKAGEKKILIVGGGKPHKRLDFFIRAVPDLIGWIGNVKILVAGHKPSHSLIQLMEQTSTEQYFEILGPVNDMESLYKKADLHVVCSEDESFGLCVIEAMCFGLPTVGCSSALGTRNLIVHGHNGLLYPDNKHKDAFVAAIVNVLTDDGLYERLSKNCQRDSAMYSQEKYIGNWTNLIESVHADDRNVEGCGSGEVIKDELKRYAERLLHIELY